MESQSKTSEGLDRLANWSAWCKSGHNAIVMKHYYPAISPMFKEVMGGYRGEEDDRPQAIDDRDAEAVEKRVNEIAPLLRAAVLWRYLHKHTANCIFHLDRMPVIQIEELVSQAARAL